MYYNSCDEKYLEECRSLGWDDKVTQKYLDYRRTRSLAIRRGRTAFKDSNQSKVYRAEWEYHKQHGYGKKFKTIDECEKYVERILKSKLWLELCGGQSRKMVSVSKFNARRYSGMAYGGHIKLSESGFNQYVILHELAHCCGNMHHDLSFRQDLVKLVSRFLGREQAKALKNKFKENGLKMSMKQKIKSPLEWIATYNRLTKARAELPSA